MIVRRRESVERAVSPVRSADQRRAALLDLTRDSPDDSRTGVNIGAFPAFLQDRRKVRTAIDTSRNRNVVVGLICSFSLALGRTPPVGCS
jgi:hypothetical protein